MTREEQIDLVASEFSIGRGNIPYTNGFKAGAQWADANPIEEEQHRLFLMARNTYKKLQSQLAIAVEALNKEINNSFDPATITSCKEYLAKINSLK